MRFRRQSPRYEAVSETSDWPGSNGGIGQPNASATARRSSASRTLTSSSAAMQAAQALSSLFFSRGDAVARASSAPSRVSKPTASCGSSFNRRFGKLPAPA